MKNIGDTYDWQAMVIVTVLMLIGIGMIGIAGFFTVTSFAEFIECFMQYGMVLIFGGFFAGVGIYCWILYFRNVVIKPKEKILFLKDIEDGICTFIDNKGKVFYFVNNDYTVNTYYTVLKTKDHIHTVIGIAVDNFEIKKERPSYWLNFYTPMGDFENIFLLPIVYVIGLPFVFAIIFVPNNIEKVIVSIPFIGCMAVILYDLKEKIRRSKN